MDFSSVQSISRVQLFATRPPCPSPIPRVHSNSHPSGRWCHPAISSCVVPFSSCAKSLQASGSFPMSQLFTWGDQSIGVSASTSVLPMNTQDWSPLGGTGWISLQSKGLSRVFSNTTVQKHPFLWRSAFFIVNHWYKSIVFLEGLWWGEVVSDIVKFTSNENDRPTDINEIEKKPPK